MTTLIQPPRWSIQEFERDASLAIEEFMRDRLAEPGAEYKHRFHESYTKAEHLFDLTENLTQLEQVATDILGDKDHQYSLRYIVGPPISRDDLATIAGGSLAPSKLKKDSKRALKIIRLLISGLDSQRFPWILVTRQPSATERHAALMSSAALMASQQLRTYRANQAKEAQESAVKTQLRSKGFFEVKANPIQTTQHGPAPGHYCGETLFGDRKADIIVGLYDRRIMPIECKVSNSASNSIKRLNNDSAVKAIAWLKDFGQANVVPAAVLAGVFKTRNLEQAQSAGLAIFWQHDLTRLGEFVSFTRRGSSA